MFVTETRTNIKSINIVKLIKLHSATNTTYEPLILEIVEIHN